MKSGWEEGPQLKPPWVVIVIGSGCHVVVVVIGNDCTGSG